MRRAGAPPVRRVALRRPADAAGRVFQSRGGAGHGRLRVVKANLLRLIAVFLLAPSLPVPAEDAATPARALFRGEVAKVGLLSAYTGSYVFAHSNPRFFLKIRIADEPAAPLEWKRGEVVVLAIHSIVALFDGEPTEGAVYTFSIGTVRKGGKLRYDDLKVESGPPGR
jgi:hypothetical protein